MEEQENILTHTFISDPNHICAHAQTLGLESTTEKIAFLISALLVKQCVCTQSLLYLYSIPDCQQLKKCLFFASYRV